MAKQGSRSFHPTLVSLAVASCFTGNAALANPTGAQVVNGQVSVIQNGNLLQITNSPNSIINWQSFSIGANEITRFIQQSQASAVLNRVTGSAGAINPSVILGALQSNGRVFLINPSGIVFGPGAQIDVAGLVASSLNLSNQDFLGGKLKFTDMPGAGSVMNQGNITTGSGGQVYLVGPAVENKGIIASPNGEVVLAAGNSVELVNPGTPNLRVEVTAPDNEAKNLGQIMVDSGRAGIYAGLVTNSGAIRADSVVSEGGKILLKATKSATLTDTSVLSAQGSGGGEIKVLAGDQVNVAGKLDASAPVSGDGGFVETSANRVTVADGTQVNTLAAAGKTGTWLVDPSEVCVGNSCSSGTIFTWGQVQSGLASSNFTITTSGSGSGDITIADNSTGINSSHAFQLLANTDINVNGSYSNPGNGDFILYAGWNGNVGTPGISAPGSISINAPINVGSGSVFLNAGASILQGSTSPITADKLLATTSGGGADLNAPNMVNTIAGSAVGGFGFTNNQALAVGTVNGVNGVSVFTSGSDSNIAITANNGGLTVNQPITASASYGGSANVVLTGDSLTLNTNVVAYGGNASFGGDGGGASVNLDGRNGAIQINASVVANGGNAGFSGQGGAASAIITTSGAITVNNGGVLVHGGAGNVDDSGYGLSGGSATIAAYGGSIAVTSSIDAGFQATGGDGGNAYNYSAGSGGNASVGAYATGAISVNSTASSAGFQAIGGNGGNGTSGSTAGGSGGSADVGAYGGSIDVTGGSSGMVGFSAQGGNGGAAYGGSAGGYGGSGSVNLNSLADITFNGGSYNGVAATGGTGGTGGPGSPSGGNGGNGGSAWVALNAANDISLTGGGIAAIAGDGGAGGAGSTWGGQGGAGSWSSAYLSAGNNITMNGSGIAVNGGNGGIGGTGGSRAGLKGGGSDASLEMEANNTISLTNTTITVQGGNGGNYGGSAYAYLMTSTGDINLTGTTINVMGGSANNASGGYSGGGGSADVYINSGRDVKLTGSSVTARGGDGAEGGYSYLEIYAARDVSLDINSGLFAYGGNAISGDNNYLIDGGEANVWVSANSGSATIDGNVVAVGGAGGTGYNSGSINANGGNAYVSIYGATGLTVGGTVTATAGAGGAGSAFTEGSSGGRVNASGGYASVYLSSDNLVTVSGNVAATGGAGGNAYTSGSGNASGGSANVQVSGSSIDVSGAIAARGGNGGSAAYNYMYANGGGANISLYTGPSGSITVGGSLAAYGGQGGRGSTGEWSFGMGGGTATVSLSSGSINVNSITAIGGQGGNGSTAGGGGDANVYLSAPGAITVGSVTAQGGNAGSGFSGGGGGSARIQVDGGEGSPAGNVTINGTVAATGGSGSSYGGYASVSINSGSTITLNSAASVEAYAGNWASANVTFTAGSDITLASGSQVEAAVGSSATGPAVVSMTTPGSISVGGNITTVGVGASSETTSGIYLTAGNTISGSGILSASYDPMANSQKIALQAVNGIGQIGTPIVLANDGPDVSFINTGTTGDIAVSFLAGHCGPSNCALANSVAIESDLNGLLNNNPTGIYSITTQGGTNFELQTTFTPNGQPLMPGQSVVIDSNGAITLTPSASILGAAQVKLMAQTGINLNSGSSVSASGNILLKSDAMDIQGTVTAGNNIYVTTANNAPIDLGNSGAPGGTLALDGGELGRLTALGVGIGSDGTAANTGAMTISGPIGPFSAFPNLFGSSITETTGYIVSPGGLNATASGNIALTNPSNNIGAFSAISTGGGVSLVDAGNLGLGAINATGTVSLTSSGGAIFNLGGAGDGTITAPTVVLAAANGVGQNGLPIFVPTATSVTATNSTSGDIVLSQPSGTFTIGTGGWQLSNSGGDYIIGGNTVTLNSGAPSSGNMFVAAATDINVGPTGYTNSGSALLTALNNVNVNGNLTASDIGLLGGNQVNINGATVSGTNSTSVLATQLNITAGSSPAWLKAGSTLGVVAGEINLTGGSGTNAFAEMSVGPVGEMDVFSIASPATTGNVNLVGGTGSGAYARIYGDPDVGSLLIPVSVGGVINLTGGSGSGAFARIESASVNSVHVDFTNVTSGGYFVNGTEGTVSSGQSGFFAGGVAAILGQNLLVSYGGQTVVPSDLPPSVQTAINQVVATSNQQTDSVTNTNSNSSTDSEGSGTVSGGDSKEDKQKKQLPICGK